MSRLRETLQGDSVKPCVQKSNPRHEGSARTFKANDLKRGESLLLSASAPLGETHSHSSPTETLGRAASEC